MRGKMKRPGTKLLLAGFSGSGKSTVLEELEHHPGPFETFLDLDELVRGKEGSVATFVARHGWEAFRDEELRQLEQTLERPESLVVALGGGTLERGWPLIERFPDVQVCHLACPFEVCWQRLAFDAEERPLAQAGKEALSALYEKRRPSYARAHFSVDSARSLREVALAILQGLRVA